ncbi:MAG TPA: PAS domain-containing sensor histidine kinase [Candidatus Limnocylindria bacterium]|nr:PAS domain-containing sensor histidine kinase [Candidatus Limnocylindria bacterium]
MNCFTQTATREQLAEQLEALMNSALDAIITIDAQGCVAAWNPAAEAMFGWAASEVLGRVLGDLIVPPAAREAHRLGVERLVRTGEPRMLGRRVEVKAQRRTGDLFDAELTLARLAQDPSRLLFVAHVRDITERKRSEQVQEAHARGLEQSVYEQTTQLASVSARLEVSEAKRVQSELLFRRAFRSSPVALTIAELGTGIIIEANDTFLELSGYVRDRVIGHTSKDLNLWASLTDRETFLRDLAQHGFVRNRECQFQRASGEITHHLVSAELIEMAGSPHIFAASLNINAQKHAETELRRALDQEQELRRLKSSFVSLVSHEYRTPLGVIQSSAEILDVYFDRLTPSRRRLHLADIKDAASTMTRLMDDVLFLERSESGKLACRPASLDLPSFCRELIDAPSLAAQAGRIQFVCEGNFPLASADASLLRLAINNLLGNALKYSPENLPVKLSLERMGETATLSVADQGIGIPAADMARLFEPFHRARNVGERPGSGLGLVIVRKCATLHGGTVQVQSRESHGTTFVLSLPLFRPSDLA